MILKLSRVAERKISQHVFGAGVICLLLAGCSGSDNSSFDASREEVVLTAETGPATEFETDVPLLHESMLYPDYWQQRLKDDALRLSGEEINALNVKSLDTDPNLHNMDQFPDSLSRKRVIELIDQVSRPASSPRYRVDGALFSEQDYDALETAVQRSVIPEQVSVRWGMVVARGSMRSYPTDTRILKNAGNRDLDRFQETGVFPGQRLAILHESVDGEWWFAVNYHYAAWLPKKVVAIGERSAINHWYSQSPRLMVTGAQVQTNYNPVDPRTSEVVLDMGISLPLLSAAELGHNINGQNPHASHIVSLPVRNTEGELEFEPTLIGRAQDVALGALEYRPSLVLQQAFKFLGERYGWGHDYNGRDCTGFVGEVYKSFGILMPRNSGQQGKSDFAPTKRFAPEDHAARAEAIASLKVGDLIYIPGHVMLYIGEVDGEPYVIHDVTGLSYYQSDESLYRGTLSGVSVTPLSPMRLSKDKSYIDGIYAIKTII